MSEPQITHNEAESRYELSLDGEVIGRIDYERDGDVIDMTHTVVDEEHNGKGYAGKLADFALEDVRSEGLMVRPTCPYIAHHIEKNLDFQSIVVAE